MREKAFLFGDTKSLVGIVTDPPEAAGADRPAVVLLNAGLLHHVGPNRIHVKIARDLASAGFVVLRFDFSGIGDSPPRTDRTSFADSMLWEIRQALDTLESSRGIRRFLLVGICSGADNALRGARADERVVGAVLIEGHAVPTPAYYLRLYRKRLSSPRSWLRLLAGKSELWTDLLRLAKRRPRAKGAKLREPSLVPSRAEVLESLSVLGARGVRLLLVYSGGSPSYCFYESLVKRKIAALRRDGTVHTKVIAGADHVFTHRATQAELKRAIFEWAIELVGREERSAETLGERSIAFSS